MNKLSVSFISLLIILTNVKSSDSIEGDGDYSYYDGEFGPNCACYQSAFDIISECGETVPFPAGQRDIGCFADEADFGIAGVAFLSCFNADTPFGPFAALGSPLFGIVDIFGLGICVNSPNGILGLIGELIDIILDLIDEFDDCFDIDRRRLTSSEYHGSVKAVEKFIELLECKSRQQCIDALFAEGNIVELAAKMKQYKENKDGSGSNRRLLSSEDDDLEICDFLFFAGFLLEPLAEEFDGVFETLLGGLFASADCDDPDNFFDGIVCEILDRIDDRRRRLESDDGDSRDGDGDDFPLIRFTLEPENVEVCADNIADAAGCISELGEFPCLPVLD